MTGYKQLDKFFIINVDVQACKIFVPIELNFMVKLDIFFSAQAFLTSVLAIEVQIYNCIDS